MNHKILFLGETYRADALSWISGVKEFGNFEVETFELKIRKGKYLGFLRALEFLLSIFKLRKIIKNFKPDLILSERVTSYGFLAALTNFPKIVVAQQGITDIYPMNSKSAIIKSIMYKYALNKAILIHAWGEAMLPSIFGSGISKNKVLVLPKGIDLRKFEFIVQYEKPAVLKAVVTRSLFPEYCHDVILRAFSILKAKNIPFHLIIIGDGKLFNTLTELSNQLGLCDVVTFTGRIDNQQLPSYLGDSSFYISMPTTEGVSSSLFEAMACGCLPIVSDLRGNRSWINNGSNGFLVKVNDYQTLADTIEYAWLNYDSFHPYLASNRRIIEEQASFEKNMALISQLYLSL